MRAAALAFLLVLMVSVQALAQAPPTEPTRTITVVVLADGTYRLSASRTVSLKELRADLRIEAEIAGYDDNHAPGSSSRLRVVVQRVDGSPDSAVASVLAACRDLRISRAGVGRSAYGNALVIFLEPLSEFTHFAQSMPSWRDEDRAYWYDRYKESLALTDEQAIAMEAGRFDDAANRESIRKALAEFDAMDKTGVREQPSFTFARRVLRADASGVQLEIAHRLVRADLAILKEIVGGRRK